MPPYESLVVGLRILAVVVGCGAVVHLFVNGLHKQYRILFLVLCIQISRSISLFIAVWVMRTRQAYSWTWVHTEPIMWLSYILLVFELYSLVLQNYKGLATVGRWVLSVSIPIAVIISFASVLHSLQNPTAEVPVRFYFDVINRGVMFALVIVILLILFFLSRYPITLSRNVVMHCLICTIFLISASMGYLVRNVQGSVANHAVNLAHLMITAVCWGAWLVVLTPQGEAAQMVVRREWSKEDEQRLVDQLTAINSSLLRVTRK